MNYKARYWKPLENGKIECYLCPRHCRLSDQQRAFCFVRQNINGEMILTTYGRSSGFCIDPIEKKPLNHFYPGTSILSFGTAGCNLGCKFCQNWDISKSKEFDRLSDQASPKQIAQTAKKYKCDSVAFTYNDPVIFAEYAIDIAKECKKLDIKTVVVSAGYINQEAHHEFFEHMDAANIDLKSFSENFYNQIAFGHLKDVLETLVYIKRKTSTWLEITNLLIPGENDSEKEIRLMSQWIAAELGKDVPLHFTAFHPDFKMLNRPQTPIDTLLTAKNIAQEEGLKYVYVGNVHDKKNASTYCSNCDYCLIERDWFVLSKYDLVQNNQCPKCGSICSGFFAEKPGSWGAKRLPVRIDAI